MENLRSAGLALSFLILQTHSAGSFQLSSAYYKVNLKHYLFNGSQMQIRLDLPFVALVLGFYEARILRYFDRGSHPYVVLW